MPIAHRTLRLALIAPAMLCAAAAQAQLIDELELRRVGDDAVLRVRFITPVQYLRSVATGSGDLAQIYYDILPTQDQLSLITTERRIPSGAGPALVVLTDEAAGPTLRNRKLLLRLAASAPLVVRGGPGDRNIEITVRGQGAALLPGSSPQPPAAAAAPPAAPVPPPAAPPPSPPAALPPPQAPVAPGRPQELLAQARQAMESGDYGTALARLDEVLALPPNDASQEAQELIALARWRAGDPERARTEFELYLRLYPQGPGADRAREALCTLAPAPVAAPQPGPGTPGAAAATTTLSGSVSSFYYGGQSKIRTQEFQDSPLGGVPQLVSDATLSGTDQRQLLSNVDLNWRRRDADTDLRLVLRDSYLADLIRSDKSKNRLTAMYVDWRSQSTGLSVRAGRQSPTGGGVLYRFDGVQVGYRLAPQWRVNGVVGRPSDSLLDTRRSFYGVSVDADALAKNLGATFYVMEQRIDSEVDRRALGSELRFQRGALSGTAQLDYDVLLHGLNIATAQGTWQLPDNSVVNVLYDRRATPILALGNGLFLQNPVLGVQATRIQDLLATRPVDVLRHQVRDTTAFTTQGMVGATKPITRNWQVGADVRLTNIGELPPVPDILPAGQPGTGNIWSVGGQVIGTNLYSSRDTHVLVLNLLKAPAYRGTLISYNNSSAVNAVWLLEPALRYYRQHDATGIRTSRWAPAMRLTYRATPKLAIESELDLEFSDVTGPSRTESSRRLFYYFGLRYDL